MVEVESVGLPVQGRVLAGGPAVVPVAHAGVRALPAVLAPGMRHLRGSTHWSFDKLLRAMHEPPCHSVVSTIIRMLFRRQHVPCQRAMQRKSTGL